MLRVCRVGVEEVVTACSPPPPRHQLGPVRFKHFIVSPSKAFIYKARVFHSASVKRPLNHRSWEGLIAVRVVKDSLVCFCHLRHRECKDHFTHRQLM